MKIILSVLCVAVLGVLIEPAGALELYINAGGPEVVSGGRTYLADGPYTVARGYGWEAGADYETWHAIGGCADDILYQDAHHNCGTYRLDVPDGQYVLTLHLVDFLSHGVGQYKMGWMVNGIVIADFLDLYAMVGGDYAVDYRCAVTATGGQIVIDDLTRPRSQLAAISLQSHSPDAVAPATPVLTEILGGFDQVILDWEPGAEPDLMGYRVYRQVLPGGPSIQVQAASNLVSRYIDKSVDPGTAYRYWVAAVDVYGNASGLAGPWDATPQALEASPLPLCRVDIDPDSLAALNVDPEADHYYPCSVTLGNTTYTAGVKYRGNVTRKLSKKSYKLKLGSGQLYQGRSKLNVNADMCDPALMRESLSENLFLDTGVPAPRTWWRALVLNGEYMGAYCDVEDPDKRFLTAHGLDSQANVYKCEDRLVILPDSADYVPLYEKETNDTSSYDDLIEFIETLNLTSDREFYETIIDILDIKGFIDYFTVLSFINDGDAIFKNYILYHSFTNANWKIIPWDKDLSWGIRWVFEGEIYTQNSILQGIGEDGNMLYHRMFGEPLFRNLFASRLYERLTEDWPLDNLYARIDANHALTEANGEVDIRKWFWEENARLRQGDQELRGFAADRADFVLDNVSSLVTAQALYINEFMAANTATLADEQGEYDDWLEIFNPGPLDIQMSDYYLTDDLAEPIQWSFPDTLLPAGQYLLVWADEDLSQGPLHANFKLSADGELIALHKREGVGGGPDDIDAVDLVFFGPQSDDISRARIQDGDYRWHFEEAPTPGASNADWQAVDAATPRAAAPHIDAWPNPFRNAIALTLSQPAGEGAFEIVDPAGRVCARIAPTGAAQARQWRWDRRVEGGGLAPAGIYWARWRPRSPDAGGRAAPVQILLIR
jgi:hypothetical protein